MRTTKNDIISIITHAHVQRNSLNHVLYGGHSFLMFQCILTMHMVEVADIPSAYCM